MKLCLMVFLLTLCSVSFAYCEKESDQGTQTEINLCLVKQYKLEDQRLNSGYRAYQKYLSRKADKKLLLNAQRAWILYKENDCELNAMQAQGGSLFPQLKNQCLIQKTQVRTKELQQLKACTLASTDPICN